MSAVGVGRASFLDPKVTARMVPAGQPAGVVIFPTFFTSIRGTIPMRNEVFNGLLRCWLILFCVLLGCKREVHNTVLLHPETGYRFPPVSEISRIHVKRFCYAPKDAKDEFDLPKEYWDAFFDGLSPSEIDPHSCKWCGLADIEVTTKGQEGFVIAVFETYERLGAFAAGVDFEHRVYYRGGDSERMKHLLEDACHAVSNSHETTEKDGGENAGTADQRDLTTSPKDTNSDQK